MNFEPLLPQLGKDQLGITKDDDDDGDGGDGDSDDDALLSAGEPKPFNFYWHLKPFWAYCQAKVVLMQALCKRMLIE